MNTQVNHKAFGTGTVIANDGTNVTVDFNGTIKVMVIAYSRLTNVDGTPYGTHAVAEVKKAKKTGSQKRIAWEKTLTEEQKRAINFENADGSRNYDAVNRFNEERSRAAWASIGY